MYAQGIILKNVVNQPLWYQYRKEKDKLRVICFTKTSLNDFETIIVKTSRMLPFQNKVYRTRT